VLREAGKRFAIEVRHLVIQADRVSFYIKPADGFQLPELLKPLSIGHVYTDGYYAYYGCFSPEVLTVTKKNTQKTERKHLSLRTWSARLVRKGIRFSKTAQMRKIVVALAINVWFFGRVCLVQ
jgi:insertion element IS1 protein InsB